MGRRSQARALDIWMNGERVGRWTLHRGEHRFAYHPDWLSSPLGRPLSLSMPLRPSDEPYRARVVAAFFDNLLPDSEALRRRMMSRFGALSTEAFDLLEQVGRDCVGAVQLLAADAPPPDIRTIRGRAVSRREVADLLARLPGPVLGAQDEEDFRLSLAGAQEKTALLWMKVGAREGWWIPEGTTPSTHIFKLPIHPEGLGALNLSTSVENEWLCSELLQAFGVPCARCEIATFGDQKVLVVERFDRKWAQGHGWVIRLPQEDLCQALGVPADNKYESQGGPGILEAMALLRGSERGMADREDFFRTQILFWLLCAIDGHAKNFSLALEAGGAFSLTPRYDVLSAYPLLGKRQNQLPPQKIKMAMAVMGKSRHYRWAEIRTEHWLETGKRCGLPQAGRPLLEELAERVPVVTDRMRNRLPKKFPEAVSEAILEGLTSAAGRLREALARGA